MVADARTRAIADYEAELTARRAKFHETPTEALRQLGFKTEDLVDSVTREGTAEWRAIRAAEARAQAAEAKAGSVDAIKADFDNFRQSVIQQQQTQARVTVEQQFLTDHASVEKAPHLHRLVASIPNVPGAMRGTQAIIAWGHALANEWSKAGVPFANSDVAAYLEHQARSGTLGAGVPVPPQQVSGGGSGQKVRPNGSRTLSAANGSERRASPKPIEEMSPNEERAALIEAAAEARRTGG